MIWRQLSLENCVFFFIKQQPVHCSAVTTAPAAARGSRLAAGVGTPVYRAGGAFRGAPWRTRPRVWSMLRSRSRGRAFSSRQHCTALHHTACLLSQGARSCCPCCLECCCCCLASCSKLVLPAHNVLLYCTKQGMPQWIFEREIFWEKRNGGKKVTILVTAS